MPPLLISVSEAAEQLRISRSGLYRLIRSGQLHAVKIGKSRRVPVTALATLARTGTEGPSST